MTRFFVICSLFLGAFSGVNAASLQVNVQTKDGAAAENAVVSITPITLGLVLPEVENAATMTQKDTLFRPFVLPISVGTTVTFPNLDEFRHQVYSFSKPKRFELRLYGQDTTNTITFDKPGIVALGCNIHDNMLAFIYVSEAPLVGKTDVNGTLLLEGLPAGEYGLSVWHPDEKKGKAVPVTVTLDDAVQASALMTVDLRSVRREQQPPADEGY
ncbi:methylamine utilization protein [Kordiimonas sp.]|uniref:methylamine utilization protein n=1 Tax=Kordiimonas sp. TaxID=1970157 RepID=UPI003A8E0BFA